jgi:hypothetical protein
MASAFSLDMEDGRLVDVFMMVDTAYVLRGPCRI